MCEFCAMCLYTSCISRALYICKATEQVLHGQPSTANELPIFAGCLHRPGICQGTASGSLAVEPVQVQLNVGTCDGFNETYNAFTGFRAVSTINIEEIPNRKYFCHTCSV